MGSLVLGSRPANLPSVRPTQNGASVPTLRGPLGALARPTNGTGVSVDQQKAVAERALALRQAAVTQRVEQMHAGRVRVEVATDFSASTESLNAALSKAAQGLERGVKNKYPQADVGFGIFGGGDLVRARGKKEVLSSAHVGTSSWESTFDRYLKLFTETLEPDGMRANILISFHDATPNNSPDLHTAVERINQGDTTVFIIYVPTFGAGGDKETLQALASSEGGLKNGVFLDFEGVDFTNDEVLGQVISRLVKAVEEANKRTAAVANLLPAAQQAMVLTTLRSLAVNVVNEAKLLTHKR